MANGGRPRVLLLAYACSPFRGSEPGIGWHRAIEVAKYCDTWVICKQQDYEADIRRYFAVHPAVPGLHFTFVPVARSQRFLRRVPPLWYAAYNLWHRRAFRRAVVLHSEVRFDLVHQVTLSGFREPGYLWKLGVPFVWGPVGGTENYPWRFLTRAGAWGGLQEGARSIANMLQFRFSPRVAKAARAARVLLAANSTAGRDLKRVHNAHPVPMPIVGSDAHVKARLPQGKGRPEGGLRLLWSGLLEPRKALHLLIEALARLPESVDYELRILGRGEMEGPWRRLAERRNVARRCTWMGWLLHEEAQRQYEWADLFVLTSLRDSGPGVVMEALGHGVPVLCLDHQGAADVVTPECGIKIPVTSPREVISGLRDAIAAVAHDPGILEPLRLGALARAQEHLWSRQGRQIAELYEGVLGRKRGGAETGHDLRATAEHSAVAPPRIPEA
jgi:glycosyltransferase involved in cell wall biosynthesis